MNTFAETEAKLKQLLVQLKTVLSEKEIQEVGQFIDVGEYGVALETLCSILDENKKTIPFEAYDLIDKVGRKMFMEPSIWNHCILHESENTKE